MRFQFELPDLAVDTEQRLFELLNTIAGLTEDSFQLIGWRG